MKQVTSSKVCLKCRGCCVFDKDLAWFAPVVAKEEHQHLLNLTGVARRDFTLRRGKRQTRLVPYKKSLRCTFLDPRTWACRVYFSRPFDCRFYPYLLMWNEEKTSLLFGFHTGECPAHEMKSAMEQGEYRQYVINYITSPEVLAMIRRNPELVWDYDLDFEAVYSFPFSLAGQETASAVEAVNSPA